MKISLNDYESKDIMRIIREWTELTQKEFAESIGLQERTVRAYEAGDIKYNIETLQKISKVHKVMITFEK